MQNDSTRIFLQKIEKINPVTKHWWTWFYVSVISLATITYTILAGVSGETSWKIYLPSFLQFTGIVLGMFIIRLMNKRDRNFFIWKSFAYVAWLLNAAILGFWISFVKDIVLWIIDGRTFVKWGKPQTSKDITKMSNMEWLLSSLLIAFLVGVVGYLSSFIPSDHIFHMDYPYLDSLNTALLAIAILANGEKRRESRLFFVLFGAFVIVQSIVSGQLVSIVAGILGLMNFVFSTIMWYGEYKLQEFSKIE